MHDTWQALADPSRRTILDRLRNGPATAGDLGEGLAISQPAVSRHLRLLREAGVVTVETDGRSRVYTLAPEPLAELEAWLTPYRDLWAQRMDALATEVARGRRRARPDHATHSSTTTPQEDTA